MGKPPSETLGREIRSEQYTRHAYQAVHELPTQERLTEPTLILGAYPQVTGEGIEHHRTYPGKVRDVVPQNQAIFQG